MNLSSRFAAVACALPLALVVLAIVRAESVRSTQTTWRLPITGYDPRDLLRGRYLQFRFELPPPSECTHDDCCWCPQPDAAARELSCTQAEIQCPRQWMTRSVADGQQRFYVSERQAGALEAQLIEAARTGDAHATFVVDPDHRPQFLSLELGTNTIDAMSTP